MFDDLTAHFNQDSVFMDVAAIEPGRDFRKAIDQSVASCSVLLALIGRDWLDTKDAQGNRRLDSVNDFVRIELASALRRDIPVIPVLVRGAKMPRAEQLPEDLQELHYRNAVELTHARWKSDVQVLIRALRPYMESPAIISRVPEQLIPQQAPPKPPQDYRPPQAQVNPLNPPSAIDTNSGISPSGPPTLNTAPAERFGWEAIDRITRALASYIGPISETIVKRAAGRCTSIEELCQTVSREIESEANRAKFLSACR